MVSRISRQGSATDTSRPVNGLTAHVAAGWPLMGKSALSCTCGGESQSPARWAWWRLRLSWAWFLDRKSAASTKLASTWWSPVSDEAVGKFESAGVVSVGGRS